MKLHKTGSTITVQIYCYKFTLAKNVIKLYQWVMAMAGKMSKLTNYYSVWII
jgi:hypothetical protein